MDDLVEWLRAQLDVDERIARGCSGSGWREYPTNWVSVPSSDRVALVVNDGDRAHVIRHDPARVLREIDAKRRIIAEHDIRSRPLGERMDCQSYDFPCKTLRLLALPYDDRPGYRKEWRP